MTVKRHALIIPDHVQPTVDVVERRPLSETGEDEAWAVDPDLESGRNVLAVLPDTAPGGDMSPQVGNGGQEGRADGLLGVLTPGRSTSARWSWSQTSEGQWRAKTSPQVFNRPFVLARTWQPDLSRNMGEANNGDTAGIGYVQRVRLAANKTSIIAMQGYGAEPREGGARIRGMAVQIGPDDDWPFTHQTLAASIQYGWWSREPDLQLVDFDVVSDPETGEWVFAGFYTVNSSSIGRIAIMRSRDGELWATVGEFTVGAEEDRYDIVLTEEDVTSSRAMCIAIEFTPGGTMALLLGVAGGLCAFYSHDGGASLEYKRLLFSDSVAISSVDICRLDNGQLWGLYSFGTVFEGEMVSNTISFYSRLGEDWTGGTEIGYSRVGYNAPAAWTAAVCQRPDGHGQLYVVGKTWSTIESRRSFVGTRTVEDADVSQTYNAFERLWLGEIPHDGGEMLQAFPVIGSFDESTWPDDNFVSKGAAHTGPCDVAAVSFRGRVYVSVGWHHARVIDDVFTNLGGAVLIYETRRWSPVFSARGLMWEDDHFFGTPIVGGRPYHQHWSPVADPTAFIHGWNRFAGVGSTYVLDAALTIFGPAYYELLAHKIPNPNGLGADDGDHRSTRRSFLFEAEFRVVSGGSEGSNQIGIRVKTVDPEGIYSELTLRFWRSSFTTVSAMALYPDSGASSPVTVDALASQWLTVWGGYDRLVGRYVAFLQVEDGDATEIVNVSGIVSPGGADPELDEKVQWGHLAAGSPETVWRLFQFQRATTRSMTSNWAPLPPYRVLTEDVFDSRLGGVMPNRASQESRGVQRQIRGDSGVFNNDTPCRTNVAGIDCGLIKVGWRGTATSTGRWRWLAEQRSGVEAAVGSPMKPGRYDASRSWTTNSGVYQGSTRITLDVEGVDFDAIGVIGRNWPSCRIEAYHPDVDDGAWIGVDVGPFVTEGHRDTSLWRASGGDGFRAVADHKRFDIVKTGASTATPLQSGAFNADFQRGARYYVTAVYPMAEANVMHVWTVRGNDRRSIMLEEDPIDIAPFWNEIATWGSSLFSTRQAIAVYSDRFVMDLNSIIRPDRSPTVYLGRPTKLRLTIDRHVRADAGPVVTGKIVLGRLVDLTRPGFGLDITQDWQTGSVSGAGELGIVRSEREHPILRSWSMRCQYLPPERRVSYIDGEHSHPDQRFERLVGALRLAAGREVVWVPDADLLTNNTTVDGVIQGAGQTPADWSEVAFARLGASIDVGTSQMQVTYGDDDDCRLMALHGVSFKVEEI